LADASGGSVTATALGGGRPFEGWKINGETVGTEPTYTWKNPPANGLLTAVFGNGDVWADAENGDDANDGSEESPLKTLAAAVALASDGDTVRAKPGTYGPFMVAGKTLDIVGEAGAEATVIDGNRERRCATMDALATLRGFTLRNGSAVDEGVNSKNGPACLGGRLEDCIVDDCGAWSDGWGYTGDYNVLSGVELERCIVRNCHVNGTLYDDGRGTTRNPLVTGNTVNYLWEGGVNENLTLAGNEVVESVVDGGTWRNCIVWGNGKTNLYEWEGGWTCMEGAEPREGDGENGPVWTDDPVFLSESAELGDFRLTTLSPYIGWGNAAWTEEGATDLAGNPRFDGEGLEPGCYEGAVEACRVSFELGAGLVQLDQRPLSGIIEKGTDATPPEVAAVSGWRFDGWTPSLAGVMEDTVFTGESSATPSDWTVTIHRGDVEADETWAAGTIHVVAGTVRVTLGATLTIEAGAVVKFAPGAKLLQDGGMVESLGATFTHLYDDEVGGDTLGDGATRTPVAGDYEVEVGVEGEGTEYRHLRPSEEIAPDGENAPEVTVWGPGEVHVLPSGYTVAFKKTLRLQPGTIVKIGDGQRLTVKGTLVAEGTAAKPVVITSMHDDAHGGDTDGDQGAREPAAGDWDRIHVSGKATFDHCSVLYGSAEENWGGIETYGGTVEFDNGEIAHMLYECVNAHNSGKFTARNSAFLDASLGFGYYGGPNIQAYNCVFQGLSTAIRQSGKRLVNCVFSDCVEFTDQSGDLSTYEHCLFWNPPEFGKQSFAKVGQNGNIWGDPKFADAANGDFHVLAGSPCIDAGDGTVAPETDKFGNARVTLKGALATGTADENGAVPDIGVHEYSGRYSSGGDVDVAVTEIRVPTPASGILVPGETATVVWRLSSVGEAAYEGGWTDRVKLEGDRGRTAVLGELSSAGRIEPGTSKLYWGTFRVPYLMDGEWALAVDANIDRGVLEGANTGNN
ncbi:MAG: DUF1565 domain-containing protein, partial [Kiritimatiellae bacterium]|nr:DUF1565 domain-containing protein [Kiritimatiellia bacterium]